MINLADRLLEVNPHLRADLTKIKRVEAVSSPDRVEAQRFKDEIIQLQEEIGAVSLDFLEFYTNQQLADELLALKFQRLILQVDQTPVELTAYQPGIEVTSPDPGWIVKNQEQYFWVTKSQIEQVLFSFSV